MRVWASRRPGRGRRTAPSEHVQEAVRRIFVYKFMRPDDFAWAPIKFPGVRYDQDGRLASGMQAKGAAHLVDAIRGQGLEIAFEDPATNVTDAIQHVLWDKWTEEEIGEHQFIGPGDSTNEDRSTVDVRPSTPPSTPSRDLLLLAANSARRMDPDAHGEPYRCATSSMRTKPCLSAGVGDCRWMPG